MTNKFKKIYVHGDREGEREWTITGNNRRGAGEA